MATLRARGVPVRVGPAPTAEAIAAELAGVDVVVASSALADDHPEIVTARSLGLPVRRRSEWLPELTAGYRLVAVAGSHGKSTTSAMLTLVLRAAGLDPTAVIGAEVSQLGGNALAGSGDVFVLESDEYGGAFAGLEPAIAVITNVEWEHPDIFPDEASVRAAFTAFARRVRPDGRLVVCGDDPGVAAVLAELRRQAPSASAPVLDYGFGPDRRWRAVDVATAVGDDTARAVILHAGQEIGTLTLAVPGRHSLLNALAVLAVATELGVAPAQTLATLATYTGAARRFEFVGFWRAGTPDPVTIPAAPRPPDTTPTAAAGTAAGATPPDSALPRAVPSAAGAPAAATALAPAPGLGRSAATPAQTGTPAARSQLRPAAAVADPVGGRSLEIIDDYAHHPTEIRLTLAAARSRARGRAVWAVLQPHTYSRFAALLDGFATAFADADRVYVTDIYAARETDDLGRHPTDLVERLAGPAAVGYVPWPELVDRLAADVRDALDGPVPAAPAGGILLLTLGAGTITTVGPRLLAALDEPPAG
ncbi:UDP-N-acetylmuramate--L-alanine ligase [Frankia sp. ArI3]|uniref:UDP-N-acetylmuramate--L-alanine ligase n=1 Tax=Frankia sp. ArI3 TaxID=1858 RepID=UPI002101D7B8|nr:Mur ligase family protein [Frankia sp. ArI3]